MPRDSTRRSARSSRGQVVINGRGTQTNRPAARPVTISVGGIFFLPPFDSLGRSEGTGIDSDDEGKFKHMVLVLEDIGIVVRVLGITSQYPPNDLRMKKYYVQLRWDPTDTSRDPSHIGVKVVRGDPFDTGTISYLNLKPFEIRRDLLVKLRKGAEAKVNREEFAKVLGMVRALQLSGSQTVGGNSGVLAGVDATVAGASRVGTTTSQRYSSSRPAESTYASIIAPRPQPQSNLPVTTPRTPLLQSNPSRNYHSTESSSIPNTQTRYQSLGPVSDPVVRGSRPLYQSGYHHGPSLEDGVGYWPARPASPARPQSNSCGSFLVFVILLIFMSTFFQLFS